METKESIEIKRIKKIVLPILKRNGVTKAGVFGSYAIGKQKKDSDIDILVELDKNLNLLDFVGIKLELEESLNKKVDLVEYSTIKPLIKERILSEEVALI